MFRVFAIAAILSLSAAAQADDSLAARIHDAAVKACATKVGASRPFTFYRQITERCVDRVSAMALASIRAREVAKADASMAAN